MCWEPCCAACTPWPLLWSAQRACCPATLGKAHAHPAFLALYLQALSHAMRVGSPDRLRLYRLYCAGTLEERLLQLSDRLRSLDALCQQSHGRCAGGEGWWAGGLTEVAAGSWLPVGLGLMGRRAELAGLSMPATACGLCNALRVQEQPCGEAEPGTMMVCHAAWQAAPLHLLDLPS